MTAWRVSEQESNHPEENGAAQTLAPEQVVAPGKTDKIPPILPQTNSRHTHEARGRRSHSHSGQQNGHYIRAIKPHGPVRDIALDATLRAAAIRKSKQKIKRVGDSVPSLPVSQSPNLLITSDDLRIKQRHTRAGNLILFVVDASGSMGARKRMVAVKGAVVSLLLDAYQKRDRVGLISFRGAGAQLLVPPTNSVEVAERQLRHLPTGGRTPLAAGLQLADQLITRHLQQANILTPLIVLITDGRSNVGPTPISVAAPLLQKQIPLVIIDSEQGFVKMGAAQQLATALHASYLALDTLSAGEMDRRIRPLLSGFR